jgi:hypothetical protein
MTHNLRPMFAIAICCLGMLPIVAQPTQPTLELRTVTGQTIFQIGERIALKLTLAGPDNHRYSIAYAGYDRSGRLDIDTFDVRPATGWSDPLAQYFSHGIFMGGGLSGSGILSSKPVSFDADLNEHVRFDLPGTYTITATSHRVGTAGNGFLPVTPYLALRSNTIEIRILPTTSAWQAEKLRSIRETLALSVKQPATGMPSEQLTAAIADLRFLNSPAAIELLASHLREDPERGNSELMWAAALGLSGVPDSLRDTALQAMSHQLDDPAFPVNGLFLTTMAGLEASSQDTSGELQPTRRPEFKAVWKQALSGLAGKQGAALATTAETLLTQAPDSETGELKAQITTIVVNNFAALTIESQISELQYNWDELNRHPMLPVLQTLMHQTPQKSSNPFYSPAELNAIVLKRWSELDPDGAAREVAILLASPIATTSPAMNPASVASLPGGPQPQFESAWATELGESTDDNRQTLLAALLVRFGTGSATAQVEAKLDSLVGNWACSPQAAALGYIVKFESSNAGSFVHRAMASTHNTQCYETLFSSVSAYAHGPALNEAAAEALANANPRAAADAAEYLRYFGTEAERQPLLERYRDWSEQWSNKPGEVAPSIASDYLIGTLGQRLAEALIANQGWLADPNLITEVLSRCAGKEMCKEIHQLASEASSLKHDVSLDRSSPMESYQIGQYTSKSWELFEAKIAQFPAGSKFTLNTAMPRNGDQLKLDEEAEALFTKHGMKLEFPATANGSVP